MYSTNRPTVRTFTPMNHLAVYGNVTMIRGRCPHCKYVALVVQKHWTCCGRALKTEDNWKKTKRMCEAVNRRKKPSPEVQNRILTQQADCCFWCDRHFGRYVYYDGTPQRLRVHWDHLEPFARSRNNADENFVAACHICNHIKSSFVFATIEEGRVYIASEWKKKITVQSMSPLRIRLRAETGISGVL